MKKTLRDQIDELAQMSVLQLQEQHRKLFQVDSASTHRQFLFRKIAWRLQADQEGGLPAFARELARAIAQDAPLRNRVIVNAGKRRAGISLDRSVTTTIAPGHDSRLPMPGGLIVKEFKGQTLVVKVLDNGFQYNDRTYSSLSAIAQEITGTKWNGFSFFALTKENKRGRS